jgi:putative peptidoglycan lipid II flippase
MSLNLIFSVSFSYLFQLVGWAPHGGLALANSLATALETIGLIVLMRRKLNGLEGKHVLAGSLQAVLAALVMSAAVWIWTGQTSGRSAWLVAILGVALGGLVYGAVVLAQGVSEAKSLTGAITRRLKSRLTD